MRIPIILDCDPGHDDAIAILLALASPELELVAITTVSGNQTVDKTTANALKVLELAGRADIPVFAGADKPFVRARDVAAHVHGESGLDGPDLPAPSAQAGEQHAVDFIADELRRRDGKLTLVATGPLTNVGLLCSLHPDARPERLVLMGGAIGEGNRTPAAEFNIWADPEAAARVFTSGIDVTMIGLDVTHKALFRPADSERLAATGRVGKLVSELFGFYQQFHSEQYGWDGSPVHDAVAVAHVVRPGLVQTADRGVVVDCGGELSRGRTYVDLWGRAGWEPNAHVAVDIDAQGFVDFLVERLASLG
jgi:pyrimidine-specific ribonucleoside hydrolase